MLSPTGAAGVNNPSRLTRHPIGGERKRHLEVVFHHLIVVKLEIGTNQIAALDAHQQEALAWLERIAASAVSVTDRRSRVPT